MIRDGHSVQHHSWRHSNFGTFSSFHELDNEIEMTASWLRRCGVEPSKLKQFRPPFGVLSKQQSVHLYEKYGLVTAMWNISPDDFERYDGGVCVCVCVN